MHRNERGATLIEILASLVILSAVGIALVSVFTQTALFADRNEAEIEEVNINQYLLDQAETMMTQEEADDLEGGPPSNDFFTVLADGVDSAGYYMEGNRGDRFYPQIQTARGPVEAGGNSLESLGAYEVQVRITNEAGEVLSTMQRLLYEQDLS
ncbi:type II secretion system protein [Alkalicoccus urumqiensis]|uniref:Prepilin-type N-terminal cleavage/methylation domain-containing protein n=1 Tax=Alkalicoccus urumqiensis TaxID=1548213 RepID=A0A2P6MEL1_ALKUR|nr:type II secretion system protein [Alkalicoccus urumqiensis]PRO64680.1 hypothetical protein C6I21_13315 [Alkalicoccus urumqiensis]